MTLNLGAPARTDWYHWLAATIEAHGDLDLLVIDPKSRFYGLDENNNDHAAQWIAALESLAVYYDLSILFAHHVSKERASNAISLDQHLSRGASALVDSSRWIAAIREMDADTAKRFGIENTSEFIEFSVVKSNYTAKPPSRIFLKRDNAGVFEFEDLESEALREVAVCLAGLLRDDQGEYTIRDLQYRKRGASICQTLREIYPKFRKVEDLPKIIELGVRIGALLLVEQVRGRNKVLVVKAV
jgi:replicative DNA helicase